MLLCNAIRRGARLGSVLSLEGTWKGNRTRAHYDFCATDQVAKRVSLAEKRFGRSTAVGRADDKGMKHGDQGR